MFQKRKLLIIFGALVFSFGMLSLGYAFWTDSLELEGNANVDLSIPVIDDIEETTTPEAILPTEEPALIIDENGGTSSTEPADEVITPATDPVDTTPVTEAPADTPPVTEAPADTTPVTEAPTDTTPVTEAPTDTPPITEAPTDTPPITEAPTDTPPITEAPTDTPPITEAPTDTPPITEAPADAPPEDSEGNGEDNL